MGDLDPLSRTYPAGVTCWVECGQPDVAAAVEFCDGLFGWQFEVVLPADAPGATSSPRSTVSTWPRWRVR